MTGKLKLFLVIVVAAIIAAGAFLFFKQTPQPSPAEAPPQAASQVAPAAAPTNVPAPGAGEASAPAVPDACLVPGPEPVVPRGDTASADDMKLGRTAIQEFVNALEAFQACREKEIADAPAGTSPDVTKEWRRSGNAAVDEANRLAGAFAEQLKIFKAKQGAAPVPAQ